ncbi:hypothetical protein, partial [Legionella waltersii]
MPDLFVNTFFCLRVFSKSEATILLNDSISIRTTTITQYQTERRPLLNIKPTHDRYSISNRTTTIAQYQTEPRPLLNIKPNDDHCSISNRPTTVTQYQTEPRPL